mmetsp:Transcript_120012/g.238937  ORF Transcript_120012/g.238937 Transcript_120012/m.238937 type:complete len:152 (+) Transcript_120012:106-561(+)
MLSGWCCPSADGSEAHCVKIRPVLDASEAHCVHVPAIIDTSEHCQDAGRPLLQELQKGGRFQVTICKTAENSMLGLDTATTPYQEWLLVQRVKDRGLVSKSNELNPELEIREGDRIVQVNGVSGFCDVLYEAIDANHRLTLTVERGKSVRA